MNRLSFLVVPAVALSLIGCGQDNSRQLAHKNVHIGELEDEISLLEGDLSAANARIAELEARPTEVAIDPSAGARDALAGSGANVEWRNGELVITLTNDILFTAGSSKLTAKAKSSLAQVAQLIRRDYPTNYVRVEGHTDSDPIVRTKNKWEDNWHLAGARARSVLHEMIERGGITRAQIAFAGYADTQPRSSNSTRSGKANNRRVAIVVLPNR